MTSSITLRTSSYSRTRNFATAATVKHEIYDLIYRHSKAAGLALAQPRGASAVFVGPSQTAPVHGPRTTTLRLLDAVPLFVSLTEDEKEALSGTMTRRTYRKARSWSNRAPS